MSSDLVRAHVVMPKETVRTIDELVGRRSRSKFLAAAAEEKLRRVRQRRALENVAGSLKNVDIPGWETPEAAREWVKKRRQADDEQFEELLSER